MKHLDHISPSSIESWTICEQKWFYQHILRLPYQASYYLFQGKVFHKYLEYFNIEKGLGLWADLKEIRDRSYAYAEQQKEEQEILWKNTNYNETTKFAIGAAYDHVAKRAKKNKPEVRDKQPLVEYTINKPLEFQDDEGDTKEITLTGRVDLLVEEKRIVDYKTKDYRKGTKRKRVTQWNMLQRLQPKIYMYMLPGYTNTWEVALIGEANLKEGVYGLHSKKDIKDKDMEVFLTITASKMYQALKTGVFQKGYTHYLCSPKYCQFWEKCHKEN